MLCGLLVAAMAVTLKQIATDFGIHGVALSNWMRQAAINDGDTPGVSSADAAENRKLRRRVKLFEQENEVLLRAAAYLGRANLSKG